jgi:hypothetical protein
MEKGEEIFTSPTVTAADFEFAINGGHRTPKLHDAADEIEAISDVKRALFPSSSNLGGRRQALHLPRHVHRAQGARHAPVLLHRCRHHQLGYPHVYCSVVVSWSWSISTAAGTTIVLQRLL